MNRLGTITSVETDGVKIKFDGDSEATDKVYKYNKSVTFAVDDRVLCIGISGTYIAICKI